uniref:7-dehydrocholesterol reductase n=1 Tax=Meloidogyne floridensis TaxID=298350 RepID=A0A915P4W6_9BILA
MSFRNRRKSSGPSSNFMSIRRRSSATQRDFEILMFQLFSLSGPLIVLLVSQLQLFFLWHIPAKELIQLTEEDPPQPIKHKNTSFESCILICLIYLFGALLNLYPGELVFIHWTSILASLSIFCLLLLLLIFLFLPSQEDQRFDFSVISQIFYGRQLRPVLLTVDLKAFITCRIGFTFWALYLISSIFEYQKLYPNEKPSFSLLTTFFLQFFYVLRRQWFEHLHTGLDNKNDRAGFYRIWMEPEFERSSPLLCGILFLLGLFFQWINTTIDLQKYNFRQNIGQLKIDGKDPFYICARYRREGGEMGTTLLLGSGYWGLCRHPNYLTEFFTFLCWTLPWNDLLIYLPLIILFLILWWRMVRDEIRCSIKYGQFWIQHCQRVPYLLIPGIY